MATVFEVYCAHPDREYALQAARNSFDLVDRLELELSRFIASSDISAINRLSAGQSVRVSFQTMACLQIARTVCEQTSGAFDISIGTGFESLELRPADFTVVAHSDGVRLDLGGIGKGYAVDRIADLLEEWEIDQALIHAGFSSVLALEPPPLHSGWPLTLSRPDVSGGGILARIPARRQAFSGSGIRKGDHILDPAGGKPVRLRTAAWVAGPCDALADFRRDIRTSDGEIMSPEAAKSPAAVADALSTAFMILPISRIKEFCREHRGLEAWILEGKPNDPGVRPKLLHFPRHSRRQPGKMAKR